MSAKHYDARTFDPSHNVGSLLKMSFSLLHDAKMAAFAGHDISFVQWIVLMKLRSGIAVTASDLCRQMRHDNGAFTRLIDQLEERGFVERQRSNEDRRVVNLVLTAAGRRKVGELLPVVVDVLNASTSTFTKTEVAELTRLLSKFIDTLKAQEQARSGGTTA